MSRWSRLWSRRGVSLGPVAFALSIFGAELLPNEFLRFSAVLLLLGASLLAVLAWSDTRWATAFPSGRNTYTQLSSGRRWSFVTVLAGAVLLSALSHVIFLAVPRNTFGAAGLLWLTGMMLVITAAALCPGGEHNFSETSGIPNWSWWETAVVAFITAMAVVLRTWNLRDVPFNIYPDEVMTGFVAERAYISGPTPPPSVFSTLWSDIELPALWFAIVAAALELGGISLAVVRFPAAVFGAVTVLPFYCLMRSVWGRVAAIAGASVMAFSAANMHYSRMALNNITTPFFWATCFFFIVRGLRTRRPIDWALAGLAAGVSEHFYYGTRLLPFILAGFVIYLFLAHWPEARRYVVQMGWLVLGYLIGFGPLLTYFVTHPGSYYGRGAGLMTWHRIPSSWQDLQQMWNTLWPIMAENLLGISTRSSQDIMYYAPLLLVTEAALLVLGVALLLWRWRHPAAFLLLLSGLGVLLVGGTLVLYPNSSPPMLAHWTPAFPFFYAAIAVPVGAWVTCGDRLLPKRWKWMPTAVVLLAIVTLAYANIHFYFYKYYADPEKLRSERYKAAQRLYEVQTLQSRYMASLKPGYDVISVGRSPYPYDAEITRYLVSEQRYVTITDSQELFTLAPVDGKGLAFLFFPGNEAYLDMIRGRYLDGKAGEVRNPRGQHVFYTYVVVPETLRSDSQRH
jgi:4-amino-4-deoxy-L-arabinose transferase-like glycosyltransferase